jgi:hypothetical protein
LIRHIKRAIDPKRIDRAFDVELAKPEPTQRAAHRYERVVTISPARLVLLQATTCFQSEYFEPKGSDTLCAVVSPKPMQYPRELRRVTPGR